MSSYRQKEVPMPESFQCPDCGADAMHEVIESCVLADGLRAKNLKHLKCSACRARFFDDAAMHTLQVLREKVRIAA